MEESFRSIKDFPTYMISNHGRVINNKTNRVLKSCIGKYGYSQISLNKNNKGYSQYLHRLVAEAFIPNPENKPEVNHKDGNKLNNNDWNLEWSTRKDNIKHFWKEYSHKRQKRIKPSKIKKFFLKFLVIIKYLLIKSMNI